ncbi:hypothetical protein [Paenibacillus sp. USHLN196]|uniref:hypothetical protein n=1 Tax=Paenibacillus sp. USHLN196 TaxID=3081291 RepID=UPI0030187D80
MATRKKTIEDNTSVKVVSQYDGVLVYKCPKTGERFLFNEFGVSDSMTVAQLRTMSAQHQRFFKDGWLKVEDDEVVQHLKLEKHAKKIITKDDCVELLKENPELIEEILSKLENDQSRQNAFRYAQNEYVNGRLRDHFVIKAIEKGLGKQLDPNS